MNQSVHIIALIIAFLINSNCVLGQNKELLVGASSSKILPNKKAKIYLAGTKENRLATGVHDPIYTKAIYISDGKNSVALVTIDCIGLLYPDLIKIRQRVAKKLSNTILNPDHIVLSSSHTHHAPDVVGLWGETKMQSGVNKAYVERLVEISANQVVKAAKNRKKSHVKNNTAKHGEGWVANISIDGELDDEVSIIQFLDAKNKSIATLTNFACHTTVLDGDATLISADYAGGLYKTLDKEYKGVNLFLQGAIGGWVQPVNIEPTYANAMNVGDVLAKVVIEALSKAKSMDNTEVFFRSSKFNFPVENKNFQVLSKLKVIDREVDNQVASEISYFKIGDASFITHPGETSPVYSTQSKKLMSGGGPKFVIGLGQDALGYILKPAFFNVEHEIDHAAYLTGMSIHSRAAIIMMQQIQQLIMNENP